MSNVRVLANNVLAQFWAGRPVPVDPFEIATKLGYELKPFFDASGWFKPSEGAKGAIYYNPSEPYVRQRFTVAHELGHALMGHGERPRDTSSSMNSYEPVEVEANCFAAELLMPVATVRSAVDQFSITDISVLAAGFNVSESAMKFRMKNLAAERVL